MSSSVLDWIQSPRFQSVIHTSTRDNPDGRIELSFQCHTTVDETNQRQTIGILRKRILMSTLETMIYIFKRARAWIKTQPTSVLVLDGRSQWKRKWKLMEKEGLPYHHFQRGGDTSKKGEEDSMTKWREDYKKTTASTSSSSIIEFACRAIVSESFLRMCSALEVSSLPSSSSGTI